MFISYFSHQSGCNDLLLQRYLTEQHMTFRNYISFRSEMKHLLLLWFLLNMPQNIIFL